MTDKEIFDGLSKSQQDVFYQIIGIFGTIPKDFLVRITYRMFKTIFGDGWLWHYMTPYQRRTLGSFTYDEMDLLSRVADDVIEKNPKAFKW